MKCRRAHDKWISAEAVAFGRPHAQDPIEPVVVILVMVGHDSVGAGVEIREFHNGRALSGLSPPNFEALFLIRKRVWRIEKENADGL